MLVQGVNSPRVNANEGCPPLRAYSTGVDTGRHDLEPVVADVLNGIRVGHIDQTEESDLNFLTRLGERYDATAAIKAGRMLLTVAGEGLTANCQAMPSITLTRRDGDQHRYSVTDRDAYSGVKAYWNDTHGAERKLGLAPYSLRELNLLGSGLLESISLFDQDIHGSGYYGCAVDDNPQLCHYYRRLYRRYGAHFLSSGLTPYTSDRGTCYAFIRE